MICGVSSATGSTGRTRPVTRGITALAATTAMNGRNTAPAAKIHRYHASTTTSRMKQAVRMAIVMRYCLSRRAWSSVRASGALVTDWTSWW